MNHINRIIFSVIGVASLILSYGFCCKANPVGLTQNCVTQGPPGFSVCSASTNFGSVSATADATPPGDPNALASAGASAEADDTLTFFGPGRHAFVEFQFIEVIFADEAGGAGASVDGQSLVGFGTVESPLFSITFGVPFTFDISVDAGVDVSGALNGHDELATASLQLTDILVVNAGGHSLRDIHLTSGSGTLYPLDAANTLPSPEPSSLSLLGFGLVTLVFVTSRKRFGLQLSHPRYV